MKKAGIFLILLAFLCIGQGFGPKIIKGPISAKSLGSLMPSGISHYWVSTNFANNSVINDWYDIIQNDDLTKASAEALITSNNLVGVWFHAPTPYRYASNNPAWLLAPDSVLAFICSKPVVAFSPMNWFTGQGSNNVAYELLLTGASASAAKWQLLVNATALDMSLQDDWSGTNDIVIVRSNNAGHQYSMMYTNGIFSAVTDDTQGKLTNVVMYNWGGYPPNSGAFLNGRMVEITHWTNINDWRNYASNYHYYRTNIYGGAP